MSLKERIENERLEKVKKRLKRSQSPRARKLWIFKAPQLRVLDNSGTQSGLKRVKEFLKQAS